MTYEYARPLVGWDATDAQWLAARRHGIGASEVAALLGMSRYRTPWQVWADKRGVDYRAEPAGDAAKLGTDLEPWLIQQAAAHRQYPGVERTPHRLYAHAEHPHRLASPDAWTDEDCTGLVECKTAGLLGWGTPEGWTEDSIPLAYELQCRWQMHVMGGLFTMVVALVAGLGLRIYHIDHDIDVERDLVKQVDDWWYRHVVDGEEPPLGAGDAAVLARRYPSGEGEVALDGTDAARLIREYHAAHAAEKAAAALKAEAGAQLKGLLGSSATGLLAGRPAVTWATRKGVVDWPDLLAAHDIPQEALDIYRKPSTRTLTVKEIA